MTTLTTQTTVTTLQFREYQTTPSVVLTPRQAAVLL